MNVTSIYPILIALGGNLSSQAGPPAATLRAALDAMAARGLRVEAVSRFYDTPCFPPGAGPDYVNAAARLETGRDAAALLETLHEVEAEFDRERGTRWGRRTLDLDLIAMGDVVRPDDETQAEWRMLTPDRQREIAPDLLILPHPRVQDRAFVLVPLLDVAPDWRHPILGLSVREMAARLPDAALSEVVARPPEEGLGLIRRL